jgi:hypothetical protein
MSELALAATEISLDDKSRLFCASHGLHDHVEKAVDFAKRFFLIIGDPTIELEQDPEDGESYLVVSIHVEGEDAACSEAHASYLSTWANSVEWPQVRLIRLIYHID